MKTIKELWAEYDFGPLTTFNPSALVEAVQDVTSTYLEQLGEQFVIDQTHGAVTLKNVHKLKDCIQDQADRIKELEKEKEELAQCMNNNGALLDEEQHKNKSLCELIGKQQAMINWKDDRIKELEHLNQSLKEALEG